MQQKTINRSKPLAVLAVAGCLLAFASFSGVADAEERSQLLDIQATDEGAQTTIRLQGTSTPTFTVYTLERPKRLIVDMSGTTLEPSLIKRDAKAVWDFNTWAVSNVSAHATKEASGDLTRVVVALPRSSSYKVKSEGKDIVLRVETYEAPKARVAPIHDTGWEQERGAIEAKLKQAQDETNRLEKLVATEKVRSEKEANLLRVSIARMTRNQERSKREFESARLESAEAKAAARSVRSKIEVATRQKNEAEAELARIQTLKAASSSKSDRETAKKIAAAKNLISRAEQKRLAAEQTEAEIQNRVRLAQKAAENAQAKAQRATKSLTQANIDMKSLSSKRQEARKSLLRAEAKRDEAENAAAQASKRAKDFSRMAELEEKRAKAAKRKRQSEEARLAKTQSDLEKDAASRADKLEKVAEALEARAAKAKALRVREETKAASAKQALAELENKRQATKRAHQLLRRQSDELASAERLAEVRRNEAFEATRKADKAKKISGAESKHVQELRAEARTLLATQKAAEKAARVARGKVETRRQEATLLAKSRDRAEAALQLTGVALAETQAQREEEEVRLRALVVERKTAERDLSFARKEIKVALASQKASLAKAKSDQAEAERKLKIAQTELAKASEKKAIPRIDVATTLKNVGVVTRDDKTRVVLELSEPVKAQVKKESQTRYVLTLPKAAIEARNQKTLDTSALPGSVKSVSSFEDPEHPGVVRVVVELDSPTEVALKRSGRTYYWDFGSDASRSALAKSSAKSASKVKTTRVRSPQIAGYGVSSSPITQTTVSQLSRRRKAYSGKRIDLEYKDADIHNLMRLLAEVGGINIVIPEEIRAKVTIRLRQVPWDQALDVILSSKQLGYKLEGPRLYRIAKQEDLDSERDRRIEQAKQAALSEAPQTEVFNLNYVSAQTISPQIAPMVSSRGTLQIEQRTNAIVINDLSANRKKIIDLLRRLDIQTPQVQIEARVVEARTSYSREFGIQWGGNAGATTAGGNATGLVFPSNVRVAGGAGDENSDGIASAPSDYAVNLPAAVGAGAGGAIGVSLGSVGGNFNLNLRLSAAEDTGDIRIISAPKVTTSNNVNANILSGVSIPISVTSAQGVQTQFVPADLALGVKPTVSLRDCAVSMVIDLTKNEADFANTGARGDPSLIKKEVRTTLLVNDGQTSVIGGIYTRNTGRSYSKVPFFADIPLLGYFFKSRAENDERSEVLIFITPKITNRDALPCQ